MAVLPSVPEASRADHVAFELSGGHAAAVRVLTRHLGLAGALRAAAGMAWRQATTDPFADLPPADDTDVGVWLTRRQLGPVLLLDDALRDDVGLGLEERVAVLGDLVATVGGKLLGRRFPALDPAAWRAAVPAARAQLARGVFARLGNVSDSAVRSGDDWLEVDVKSCRFVGLLHALGRPHLAPLFCVADSRFFDSPGAPVRLVRNSTLAEGAHRCDFRFELDTAPLV